MQKTKNSGNCLEIICSSKGRKSRLTNLWWIVMSSSRILVSYACSTKSPATRLTSIFLQHTSLVFWPIVRAVRTELQYRPVANFEDCCIEPESAMNLRFSPFLHFAVLAWILIPLAWVFFTLLERVEVCSPACSQAHCSVVFANGQLPAATLAEDEIMILFSKKTWILFS